MMGKSPRYWLGLVAVGIVAVTVAWCLPDSYEQHRVELVELFNLPEDVELVSFRSPYRRGGLQNIEGVAQFSPEQWDAYVGALGDESAWNPVGFTYRRTTVTADPAPGALRWYDRHDAVIKDGFASFWVRWGFDQREEHQGKPDVTQAPAWRTLCWVVLERDSQQTVEPCRDYRHSPNGRRFYVRALLDRENRQLFMFVR